MGKLTYNYGVMNSGKSLQLLSMLNKYNTQGKCTLLLKPAVDTRSRYVTSRIGVKAVIDYAIPHDMGTDELVDKLVHLIQDKNIGSLTNVFIDESQFLTDAQVQALGIFVSVYAHNVICFGLRTDYKGKLFEGSKTLFEMADTVHEIKTSCEWCTHKATHNLLYQDGQLVTSGDSYHIGDDEYVSVCREHFFNPPSVLR